jgi:hypothetical protein
MEENFNEEWGKKNLKKIIEIFETVSKVSKGNYSGVFANFGLWF